MALNSKTLHRSPRRAPLEPNSVQVYNRLMRCPVCGSRLIYKSDAMIVGHFSRKLRKIAYSAKDVHLLDERWVECLKCCVGSNDDNGSELVKKLDKIREAVEMLGE